MTVYAFYLFDRKGNCLCYREWYRPKLMKDATQDQKNIFGLLFALKNFCGKLSLQQPGGNLKNYSTDVYSLHYFETATGLRFILLTSRGTGDLSGVLKDMYLNVFVETVTMNPLYVQGKSITSQLFLSKLDSFVKGLACFS
eukprot:jgi/Galph1/5387/GphlegSOOS_G4051.1